MSPTLIPDIVTILIVGPFLGVAILWAGAFIGCGIYYGLRALTGRQDLTVTKNSDKI